MITKTVTSGQRTATATISEETRFIFSDKWEFYHVQNLGSGVAYVSMSAGATAGADGVIAVIADGTACTMHNFPADSVYVTSSATTDSVQIIGSNSAISPFKSSGSGGGEAYTLPQATETALGGIKAKAKTTETAECAIDADTGKIFAPGMTETLLFDGATNTTDVYTLSAAYTGFKFLIIGALYSGDELFNAIINCADIRPTADYSKKNSFYIGGNRTISFNTNGVNFKTAIFTYCKIYGVN